MSRKTCSLEQMLSAVKSYLEGKTAFDKKHKSMGWIQRLSRRISRTF